MYCSGCAELEAQVARLEADIARKDAALARIKSYCDERAAAGVRGDWDGLADLADSALKGGE